MFESFNDAYKFISGEIITTGTQFNISYRYVGWLLTVPLLLLEFILVMRIDKKETYIKGIKLVLAAILMVMLGYPGEDLFDSNQMSIRWKYWAMAMIPFLYILHILLIDLRSAINLQPKNVQGLFRNARGLLIFSWACYPIIYLLPMIQLEISHLIIQIGYTFADLLSISVFGVLIYIIAQRKSDAGA